MTAKLNRFSNRNQDGVASIMVVMIVVTVLALVTVGFSMLMNREVRQSLDRQLSAEAYYAAESGVNDARTYLSEGGGSSPGCDAPTDITPSPFVDNGYLSGTDGLIKYSCVVIDNMPKELVFNLKAGESAVFKLKVPHMTKMYLGWENQDHTKNPLGSSAHELPREDVIQPGRTGLLRTALYPLPKGGAIGDSSCTADCVLEAAARNYFMYPNGGSGTSPGTVIYSRLDQNGDFVNGDCNDATHPSLPYAQAVPRFCNAVITGLDGGGGGTSGNNYQMRLTAEYSPITVSLQVANNGGDALGIPDVQGIADVTATGNDVLSRIQARVPLGNNNQLPGFGLQSMVAICKAFRGEVADPGVYGDVSLEGGVPNSDGACVSPFHSGDIEGGGPAPLESHPCPPPYIGNQATGCTLPPCPPNSNGTPPNCVCNPGYQGTPPNCTLIPPSCPPNSHGTPPNCVCNSGFHGTPPNCEANEPDSISVNITNASPGSVSWHVHINDVGGGSWWNHCNIAVDGSSVDDFPGDHTQDADATYNNSAIQSGHTVTVWCDASNLASNSDTVTVP